MQDAGQIEGVVAERPSPEPKGLMRGAQGWETTVQSLCAAALLATRMGKCGLRSRAAYTMRHTMRHTMRQAHMGATPPISKWADLSREYSRSASRPFSLPFPDCLYPPKGISIGDRL